MSSYHTEEEQVELLKKWWKEYGVSVIVGTLLAIIIVLGWQYYRHYREQQAEQASIVYTTMMNSLLNQQNAVAAQEAQALQSQYSHTVYASIAGLVLAKLAVENGDYSAAVKQLKGIREHGSNQSLKDLATLRLARVYIAQQQAQQALELLQTGKDNLYPGLMAEIEGDAYLQLGNTAKARAAYLMAQQGIPAANINRPILAMKIADLPQ